MPENDETKSATPAACVLDRRVSSAVLPGFLLQIELARANVAAWPEWMQRADYVASACLPEQKPIPPDIAKIKRLACTVPPEYRVPLRDLVATMVGLRNAEERAARPPCVRCGAETPEQAETMCQPIDCGCPGCNLWPDA